MSYLLTEISNWRLIGVRDLGMNGGQKSANQNLECLDPTRKYH